MKELHTPKLAANMAMVTDAKGNPSASANITNTELNMLNGIRTNVQNQIDAKVSATSSWGMPDYTAGVGMAADTTYTATQDGYLKWGINLNENSGIGYITINGATFATVNPKGATGLHPLDGMMIPIPKGTTYRGTLVSMLIFYPLKKEA